MSQADYTDLKRLPPGCAGSRRPFAHDFPGRNSGRAVPRSRISWRPRTRRVNDFFAPLEQLYDPILLVSLDHRHHLHAVSGI
jgi:hypothetical protein